MLNKKRRVDALTSLNVQQKKAVKSVADRVLVLAGAGAGKTKTLIQKILYLIQEKGAKPEEIMAITFTKNAADEMLDRLILLNDLDGSYQSFLDDNTLTGSQKRQHQLKMIRQHKWISKLTIRTFHSLCYTILKTYGAKEFDNKFKLLTENSSSDESELSRLSADETQFEVLHKMLISCCDDAEYLLNFKRYIIDYMVDKLHQPSRAFIHKATDGKYYTSLRGDKVRSKSEQYICDWLYRHSINYVYEPKILIVDFEFHPDFYIPDANLYLEHVSNKSAPMRDKEEQFTVGGKTLVKTYEPMTTDTALFNLALTRIVKGRLPLGYKYDKAIVYEEELKGRHKEVRDYLRQVNRILDMIQVDGLTLDAIRSRSSKDAHERIRLFYDCTLTIIEHYLAYTKNKSYLDFNQLILTCMNALSNHQEVKNHLHDQFKYVLVDEFQDVNKIQVKLIKAMMNPNAQLFCVGDDWQSIYGFRGSDVDFILNFNKYFKNGEVIHLDKNYRSIASIVDASNEVIKHNVHKIEKQITAARKTKRKIEVYSGVDHVDTVEFLVKEIKDLLSQGIIGEEILILYRRNKMYEPYRLRLKKEKINVQAKTIHASKGLEAQVVFIIGLTEGSGGFPDIWMEDRIYQILRPSRHDLLYEEERRLFYVAITRAKDRLYLITEMGNESSFIKEIPEHFKAVYTTPFLKPINDHKCKKCFQISDPGYKFCPHCGFVLGN